MAPPRRASRRSTYAIHDFDGKGSGVERFDTGGTSFLEVAPGSGGSWTVKVTG